MGRNKKKKEIRRKILPWEKFVTQVGHNLYEQKPNNYKIFEQLNQGIRETGDICWPLHEDLCLQYYEKLWTDKEHKQEIWILCMSEEEIIVLDELEEVTKSLKNEEAPGEDSSKQELYKYAPKIILLRLLNFYDIYTSRETTR